MSQTKTIKFYTHLRVIKRSSLFNLIIEKKRKMSQIEYCFPVYYVSQWKVMLLS